jgi:endoglucanase Acf2
VFNSSSILALAFFEPATQEVKCIPLTNGGRLRAVGAAVDKFTAVAVPVETISSQKTKTENIAQIDNAKTNFLINIQFYPLKNSESYFSLYNDFCQDFTTNCRN